MNAQTPGPLTVSGPHLMAKDSPGKPARGVALVGGPNRVDRIPERDANRRLLAAAYNAFDKAGRKLGIDAATLAERIDLAALICSAREASALMDAAIINGKIALFADATGGPMGNVIEPAANLRAALATLPV